MNKRIKEEELEKISGGDHQLLPYRDRLKPLRLDVPNDEGHQVKTGRDLGLDVD